MSRSAQEADPRDPGLGFFGLQILLVTLAVLFASTVIVTWFFRDVAAQWGTAVTRLPAGLWLTSAVLVVLSVLIEAAARAAARPARATRLLAAGAVCAVLFLAGQAWNWTALIAQQPAGARPSFYQFNFYLLTLLHALHVVGGIVFHAIAWLRARAAAPGAPATLRANAIYWHFLACVWAVILTNLWLTRIANPADSWLGPASLALLGLMALICLGYQAWVVAAFFRRGRIVLALGSLLPPFAVLAFWAHAGEWGEQRTLARWTLALMLFLCFLILAVAIHSERLFGAGP
jgi:cytochrome c oxidase subunit 3